jgi:hypothetical protein
VVLSVQCKRDKWLSSERIIAQSMSGGAMKESLMAMFNLIDRIGIIIGGDGDVAAVDDLQPVAERVMLERDVVTSVEGEATRSSADPCRTKACAWTIRGASVEGGSNECDVKLLISVLGVETLDPRELGKGGYAGEDRVGGDCSRAK